MSIYEVAFSIVMIAINVVLSSSSIPKIEVPVANDKKNVATNGTARENITEPNAKVKFEFLFFKILKIRVSNRSAEQE